MNNPYTSPFAYADTVLSCRIYTRVDNRNAGWRGLGGKREKYGIIRQNGAHFTEGTAVEFIRHGAGWIARCRGPHGSEVREVHEPTQLAALIELARWIAEDFNWATTPPAPHPSSSPTGIYDRLIKRPD